MLSNREWFVFTSKRKDPDEKLKRYFLQSLLILIIVSIISYFLTTDRMVVVTHNNLEWESMYHETYLFPDIQQRLKFSLAFTFLEIMFFLLLPYSFRYALKPRVKGSSIEEFKEEYDHINILLKKDITLLMQTRIGLHLLVIINMLAHILLEDGYLDNNNNVWIYQSDIVQLRDSTQFVTAFLIIIYLIPRYLDKIKTEYQLKNIPEDKIDRDGILMSGFFFNALTYLISFLLVFGFLRMVIFRPLGI